MYLHCSFLLLVGYLFCFPRHALAAPPSSSDDPYAPSNGTSISRNTRRSDGDLHCNELKDTYVFQKYLLPLVKEFCNDAANQGEKDKNSGSITRVYHERTKEQVRYQMDIEGGAKPEFDACMEGFTSVMDDCSLPDDNNPHNVKAGGRLVSGAFTYHIKPETGKRAPPVHALGGGCKCTENIGGRKRWRFWGHGWAAVDFGEGVRQALHRGNCHPSDEYFWFYNVDRQDDNIEWEGSFDTWDDTQKKCVQDALGEAGGPTGINLCTGRGK